MEKNFHGNPGKNRKFENKKKVPIFIIIWLCGGGEEKGGIRFRMNIILMQFAFQ